MGGYIRYPQTEYKILYAKEAEESLEHLAFEMMEKKRLEKNFSANTQHM